MKIENRDRWLRNIAGKASSIHERLTGDIVATGEAGSDEIMKKRLRHWMTLVANGEPASFRQRLAWDGLDESGARTLLAPACFRSQTQLPRWTYVLSDVLKGIGTTALDDRSLRAGEPVPFEEVLLPFVTWARAACIRRAGSSYTCFTPAAHAALERQLLEWLSAVAAKPLWLELSVDLFEPGAALDGFLKIESSRALYDAFVAGMLGGGLISFLEEYSVLARLLATTAELWADSMAELLGRFDKDADAIKDLLAVRELAVIDADISISDPHHGLRCVAVLIFDSGKRIVYKPRNLSAEVAWNAFLDWLMRLGAPVAFHTFRVLDRGDYGWAEYVEYAPCKNEDEAHRYFIRAGALLALLHLMNATDCHGENLIPSGEYPVLIDLETILVPQAFTAETGALAPRLARQRIARSVLATYLLPIWSRSVNNEIFDGSGLGAEAAERSAKSERWTFVNTDQMRLARIPDEGLALTMAALPDGTPLRVYDHEEEVAGGFEAMYRFLIQKRADLLATGSPFQRFGGVLVRFVYRNTPLYSTLLKRLEDPALLRDGVARSIEIEQMAVAALAGMKSDKRPGWADIWTAEREAMERGDIPHFSAIASSDGFFLAPGRLLPGWFSQSAHGAAIEHLQAFGEEDLALQMDFIRSALRSRAPVHSPPRESRNLPSMPSETDGVDYAAVWRAEALAIARCISEQAIQAADGSVSWLQPAWSRDLMMASPTREIDVVGNDLYDGAVGIGLFLAAAERVLKRSEMRQIALGAVRPVLIELAERGFQTADRLGIGGLSGLGSVAYGLVQMYRLLGEPELLRGAERAANLLTRARLDADAAFDITLGTAGSLLALLSIHGATGNPSFMENAMYCGQRLVSRLEPAGPDRRCIRTLEGRFLNGFSHGAAGIAYALRRLHRETRDRVFLNAAKDLVEFERSSWRQYGDWPDLRQPGAPQFMQSWCHGAPGIALSRIASLETTSDDETRREIDRALSLTHEFGGEGPDFLCCGVFGKVEVLWSAGVALRRPELCDRSRLLAWQTVARARERNGYELGLPTSGRLQYLGLFQGLAGIGYGLLRLADPAVVPQVLLMADTGVPGSPG